MIKIGFKISNFLSEHTICIVEGNTQKFKEYPKSVVALVLFLSYNVILQGIADVFIKVLSISKAIFYVPLRLDFLFLTAVSVLMGFQAFKAMKRREVDVTRNSVSLGLLVESGLVASDLYYLFEGGQLDMQMFYLRLPFILITTVNFFILLYIAIRLNVFRDDNGKFILS
jgi:ABC-type multidrug transport system permease subunit